MAARERKVKERVGEKGAEKAKLTPGHSLVSVSRVRVSNNYAITAGIRTGRRPPMQVISISASWERGGLGAKLYYQRRWILIIELAPRSVEALPGQGCPVGGPPDASSVVAE